LHTDAAIEMPELDMRVFMVSEKRTQLWAQLSTFAWIDRDDRIASTVNLGVANITHQHPTDFADLTIA